MGKTYKAKNSSVDFKVTTPKNSLLSQQAVTSKGISIPYTNLQLNPYPNTQLDLFCSDNLSFSIHGSQYVTNQFDAQIPVRGLFTNLRKTLVAKLFSLSTRWRSRTSLVTKPYGVQTQQLLEEKVELGHMSPIHNMLAKNFCIELHQLWRPLKQSLYIFRVVRKESPNIYTRIGWKSELKIWFFWILIDTLSIEKLSSIELQ